MVKKAEQSPLEVGLRKVRRAQKSLDEFVFENRELIQEYLTRMNAVDAAKGAVKPLCVQACESQSSGRHTVAECHGMRAVVQVTQVIDVDSLFEEFPQLRKVANIKRTMVTTEGDRLVGAGILTKKQLRAHKVPGPKSVYIETAKDE